MRRDALALLALLALLPGSLRAGTLEASATNPLPEHHAEEPGAPVVAEENLLASERFWPYQVATVEAWQPPGRAQALRPGSEGVLIRVEASGLARIDFGRDGLYELPVRATDLVERANRIRLGETEKAAPNFTYSIAPRLGDSASPSPRGFPYRDAAEVSGFLCVFADPSAPEFAELAATLAPLRDRPGTMTILFPQGAHRDLEVRERLRALGWTVPFVLDHLAEAYTRSLLPEGTPLPALTLQTREGRLLHQGRWGPGLVSGLSSALDEHLGRQTATATP